MNSAAASSSAPLRDAGRNVQKGFAEIGFSLRPDATRRHTTSPPDLDAQDSEAERQRFELWAANLGLYSLGDRSLDYRLQDAPALREYTLDLLKELEDDLTQINDIINGRAHPPESESSSDASISANSDEEDSNDEELDQVEEDATNGIPHEEDGEGHTDPDQSDTQILFGDMVDIIDRLYKFAAKVRGPTTRSTPSGRNFYRDQYEDPDGTKSRPTAEERENARLQTEDLHTRRIAEVVRQIRRDKANLPSPESLPVHTFDGASQAFVSRMGRANAYRHQQFIFWRERERKRRLASEQANVQEMSQVPVPQTLAPPKVEDHSPSNLPPIPSKKTVRIADPTPTEDLVSGVPSQTWNLPKSVNLKEETRSVRSEATQSPTVYEPSGKKVPWPKFPKELLGSKKEFICPYCFSTCPSHYRGKAHWRSHLIQDLQPYMCTYPDCGIGDNKLLGNWEEWILHERIHHRMHYICPDHSSQTFHNQNYFSNHIKDEHGHDPQRSDFEKAARPLSKPDRACPVCQYEADEWSDMEQHMAFHLESLALLTLPQATGLEADSDLKSNSGLMQQGSEGVRGSRNNDFGSNPSDVSIEANDNDAAALDRSTPLDGVPSLSSGEALTGEALAKLSATDVPIEQETPDVNTMVDLLSPGEVSRFHALFDQFLSYDRQHVRGLFPKADADLIMDLSLANTTRRKWFILHAWTYGNVHSQDRSTSIDVQSGTFLEYAHRRKHQGLMLSGSDSRPSREETSIRREAVASPQKIVEQLVDEDIRIQESRPSYIASRYTRSGSHLAALSRMESWLPRPSLLGEARCEFCQKPFDYHRADAHLKHIYHDLEPYVCFVTDCETRGNRFHSRKAWEDHLDGHTNPSDSICPLCRDGILRPWDDLKSHMALHLKRIALFALPRFSDVVPYDSDRPVPPSVTSSGIQLSNLSRVSFGSNDSIRTKEITDRSPGEDLTGNSLRQFVSEQPPLEPWVDVYIDQYLHSATPAKEDVEQHRTIQEASEMEPIESRVARITRRVRELTGNMALSEGIEIATQPEDPLTESPSKSTNPPKEQSAQDSSLLTSQAIIDVATNLATIAEFLSDNLIQFRSRMRSKPRTLNWLIVLSDSIVVDGQQVFQKIRDGPTPKTRSWRLFTLRMLELVEFLDRFTQELGVLTQSGATTELGRLLLSRIENDDDDFVIEIKEAHDEVDSRYRSFSALIPEVFPMNWIPTQVLIRQEQGDAEHGATAPFGEEDTHVPEPQPSRVSFQSSSTLDLPHAVDVEARSEASGRPPGPRNALRDIDLTDPDNIRRQNSGIEDIEYSPITNDVLAYIDRVKAEVDDADMYNWFIELLKGFKEGAIDTSTVRKRASFILSSHPQLVDGFNSFFPPSSSDHGNQPTSATDNSSEEIVANDSTDEQAERETELQENKRRSKFEDEALLQRRGILRQPTDMFPEDTVPFREGGASSPIHRETCTLYIGNLAPPLASSALHALLQKLASPLPASIEPDPSIIRYFYVSPIRTHAFVTFRSTLHSSRVRNALYGVIWPRAKDRQALWVDYVPDEAVPAWVAAESAAARESSVVRRWEVVYRERQSGKGVGLVACHQEAFVSRYACPVSSCDSYSKGFELQHDLARHIRSHHPEMIESMGIVDSGREEVGDRGKGEKRVPLGSSQDVVAEPAKPQQTSDTPPIGARNDVIREDRPSSSAATDEDQSLPGEGQWIWDRGRKTFSTYVGKDPKGNDMFEYNDDPFSRSRPFVQLPPDPSAREKPLARERPSARESPSAREKPPSVRTSSSLSSASTSQATGSVSKTLRIEELASELFIKADLFQHKFASFPGRHQPTDQTLRQLMNVLSRIEPDFDEAASWSNLAARRFEHAIEVIQECDRLISILERILNDLLQNKNSYLTGGPGDSGWLRDTPLGQDFKNHSKLLEDSVDTLDMRVTQETVGIVGGERQVAPTPPPPPPTIPAAASKSAEPWWSGPPRSASSSSSESFSARLPSSERVTPPVPQGRRSSRFPSFTLNMSSSRAPTRLSSRATDDDSSSTKSGCVLM